MFVLQSAGHGPGGFAGCHEKEWSWRQVERLVVQRGADEAAGLDRFDRAAEDVVQVGAQP